MSTATSTSMLTDSAFAGTVIAAIIAAVIAVLLAYYQLRRQAEERKQAASAALFAELSHIESHYAISANEVRHSTPPHPIRRRLVWSKFGAVASSANLKENAILGAQQMAEVLQLSLVIRNTDAYLDELLANSSEPTKNELNMVADRMDGVAAHAKSLSKYIHSKAPKLGNIDLGR